MKKGNQNMIIGGILGVAIGVTSMFFVQYDKDVSRINVDYKIESLIRENVNTCEDMIEWISEDLNNRCILPAHLQSYIDNLEIMCEENRVELINIYDSKK